MDLATVDKLLTTTRSVRARLDLTRPVPHELIEECLEIAVQAPQGIVTDAAKRHALAQIYRQSFADFYPPERIAERQKAQP
jgi:nitroreductase